MTSSKNSSPQNQSYHNSLHVNDPKNSPSCRDKPISDNKENVIFGGDDNKENIEAPTNGCKRTPLVQKSLSTNGSFTLAREPSNFKSLSTGRVLKPSSLQLCMQMNEPDKEAFGSKIWDPVESENSTSLKIWDYSDSEAAPASSWSTLPNRALLCRTLPVDIGRCTCLIVKEASPKGLDGSTLYSLYTNEGQGRQDRKLAVAFHKRRNGKSEYVIAQNAKGIYSSSDDSYMGNVTSNLVGSKYYIWDQGSRENSPMKQSNPLAVVKFMPTIATWTGSHRNMTVYVPKQQSMQLKNATQTQHVGRLPEDWQSRVERVHKLFSRIPQYNSGSKQYELDFRDRGRAGLRVQRSVKNFQLTLEENGKQTILQLGRVDKTKFVMDFRLPSILHMFSFDRFKALLHTITISYLDPTAVSTLSC
ncbi:tubby-like protein 8 isoform X2 [Tripterygium wilfordii]|uniref:tubby-like protein 8 isoform X2 n=1 Tax=Tripterygium wilfordii TaxID=458696 RepID=UPI0018F82A20|nr:tubby-like protein 8 isoform X2 [Tripterygium wilfordii]